MRIKPTATVAALWLLAAQAMAAGTLNPEYIVRMVPAAAVQAANNEVISNHGPLPAVNGLPSPLAATTKPRPVIIGHVPADFVRLPALTREELEAIPAEPGRQRSGLAFDVDIDLLQTGEWITLENGGQAWIGAIETPSADFLRLRFAPFRPPAGVEVVLYDALEPEEAYGPFTRGREYEGRWWAPTVHGGIVHVEVHVPPGINRVEVAAAIRITAAAQGFLLEDPIETLACRLDSTCDAAWDDEARGVARIAFMDGGSSYLCSGSMLNRIGEDFAPLFLTAAHCINSEAEARTIEVYWLYQTSTCNGTPPTLSSVPRSDGATLLAHWDTTDVSLLGLTDSIPSGLYWEGWDSNTIPNNEPGTLIHHPAGTRKSISYGVYEGRDDNHCSLGDWTYRLDLSDGGQEGGSSGAPGFDTAHRVRTVASCSESGCSPGENTWEGSFPDTWSRLEPYLDGRNNVWVDIGWSGTEKGTQAEPFDELIEGYFGALDGGTVHVVAGDYPAFTWEGPRAMVVTAEGGSVIIGN